jgi:predicted transcriptional regulator
MDKDRDSDDLMMLRLRREGLSYREIAHNMGVASQNAMRRIKGIIEDDCQHDPDARPYWRAFRT